MTTYRSRDREDLDWMLELQSLTYPNRVAVIDAETGARRTYTQLQARACRVAHMLAAKGIGPGDTFGLLMHNCIEYLEIVLGAAKIGAIAVLVNRRLSPQEMAYELTDSQATGLIYSPKFASNAGELRKALQQQIWWIESGDTVDDGAESLEALLGHAPADSFQAPAGVSLADAGWVIIYTSGTTGKPKGVVLSQSNVVAANNTIARFLWARYGSDLKPVVRTLVTAGLNHIGGLTTSSLPALSDGGQLVLLDDFDPRKMLRALADYRINLAFSIGMMWDRVVLEDLSAYDFSALRVIGTCISYHSEKQVKVLHEGFGAEVYYMFGQTETTTGFITTQHTSDLLLKRGTLGQTFGYMETRIVDADGRPVAVGEVGELQYRGPSVFKEYYGRPADTEAAFQDGWFRSGDLLRADDEGYLYFVDRLKDMVKSGGLNVFTVEVEHVLLQHPDIVDAAVAGTPDPIWGEAVTAFVVLAPGARLDSAAIAKFCHERIAGYKVPKRFSFIDKIPVNALGKRLKRELTAAVRAGQLRLENVKQDEAA